MTWLPAFCEHVSHKISFIVNLSTIEEIHKTVKNWRILDENYGYKTNKNHSLQNSSSKEYNFYQ